ncbi:hypothetical protein QBC38DRAFT_65982 [Podospora fimiseda]|uniref:Heterokaryon incompatibility domain-containing protein n=1 Tax=Podospora fimiseda TaxID=252190 RepID=A0AAN6YRP7_9PEZI|nr:hypothetical protein QBC38DRAFT_65982 [Podospora fimiseda]
MRLVAPNLVATRPTLSEELSTSYWFKRAWTFQEMFFSKRLLLFTKSQVFFMHDGILYSEDGNQEKIQEYTDSKLLTLLTVGDLSFHKDTAQPQQDMDTTWSHRTFELPWDRRCTDYYFQHSEGDITGNLVKRKVDVHKSWKGQAQAKCEQLITIYAGRQITYAGNIIKAVQGVLKHFEKEFGRHSWGLFHDIFPASLL